MKNVSFLMQIVTLAVGVLVTGLALANGINIPAGQDAVVYLQSADFLTDRGGGAALDGLMLFAAENQVNISVVGGVIATGVGLWKTAGNGSLIPIGTGVVSGVVGALAPNMVISSMLSANTFAIELVQVLPL